MSHYYSPNPHLPHEKTVIEYTVEGRRLRFVTDAGVFSRQKVDYGSSVLIRTLPPLTGEVLDLGCGYGPIGIVAATLVGPKGKVCMVDVNERACELARENLAKNEIKNAQVFVGDGVKALPASCGFDVVLSNPPIRAGKSVFYPLLAEAFDALKPGGCLFVVIRTKQGAKSLATYLKELAGACDTIAKKAGFRILKCCKQLHT
ncbi:MAG TPA: 16S rRNA methyltransferase [Firmicutes bacterium]|nr:16S rRNA methyltransferase [Bacillota bacterium]